MILPFKNDEEKLTLLGKVFERMIEVPKLQTMLRFVQQRKNLRIRIDENETINGDFTRVQYNNQYSEHQIFIECKGLFDPLKITDLYGIVARRLCNYAMFAYFNNEGKPYEVNEEKNFLNISKDCLDECKLLEKTQRYFKN